MQKTSWLGGKSEEESSFAASIGKREKRGPWREIKSRGNGGMRRKEKDFKKEEKGDGKGREKRGFFLYYFTRKSDRRKNTASGHSAVTRNKETPSVYVIDVTPSLLVLHFYFYF